MVQQELQEPMVLRGLKERLRVLKDQQVHKVPKGLKVHKVQHKGHKV